MCLIAVSSGQGDELHLSAGTQTCDIDIQVFWPSYDDTAKIVDFTHPDSLDLEHSISSLCVRSEFIQQLFPCISAYAEKYSGSILADNGFSEESFRLMSIYSFGQNSFRLLRYRVRELGHLLVGYLPESEYVCCLSDEIGSTTEKSFNLLVAASSDSLTGISMLCRSVVILVAKYRTSPLHILHSYDDLAYAPTWRRLRAMGQEKDDIYNHRLLVSNASFDSALVGDIRALGDDYLKRALDRSQLRDSMSFHAPIIAIGDTRDTVTICTYVEHIEVAKWQLVFLKSGELESLTYLAGPFFKWKGWSDDSPIFRRYNK